MLKAPDTSPASLTCEKKNLSVLKIIFNNLLNSILNVRFQNRNLLPFLHCCLQCWLDRDKLVIKQVPPNDLNFSFLIKFYTPDPGLLEEELTRSADKGSARLTRKTGIEADIRGNAIFYSI